MAKVCEILDFLNAQFPFSDAEKWDNSGYLVETEREVKKVLVALDATSEVVGEAKRVGADLIITHHPVIFSPIPRLAISNPAVDAVKDSIGIISVHTNYDVSGLGADASVCSAFEKTLGFSDAEILDVTNMQKGIGFGRVGLLKNPLSAKELALKLKAVFSADSVRYTDSGKEIKKLGYCCGGGSSYIEAAIERGCDAYITSDVKHSSYITARNGNLSLFVLTHYQMEKFAMKNLSDLLKTRFTELEILESECEREPSQII